jgi:hypothetical protein
MHLLMTTFAFLLLFSIYSIAQFRLLKQDLIKDSAYRDCIGKIEEAEVKKISERTAELLTKFGVKSSAGTRRTSFLHISSLVQDKNNPQDTEEVKWVKKLLIGTIFELYHEKTFFQDAKMTPEHIEKMITQLFQTASDTPLKDFPKSPHALSNAHLDDPIVQEVFYKMMKGNMPPKGQPLNAKENYPSLEELIRFEKKNYIMSVYRAPKALLMALFEDQSVVDNVMELRTKIAAEKQRMSKQKKAQNNDPTAQQQTEFDKLKQELENLRAKLPSGLPPHLIDFNISGED